jgi:hypothetical protein|tara:strand:- start:228 stop:380 length:153 start_codon:yes stop_codon:yes gene_type:complete
LAKEKKKKASTIDMLNIVRREGKKAGLEVFSHPKEAGVRSQKKLLSGLNE